MRQVLSRDPAIHIENYANGLLIRAGQYPDLTPQTEGLSPHYLAVNQLIRPIRIKPVEGHSLHFYGVNQFDEQSTVAWYARYDLSSAGIEETWWELDHEAEDFRNVPSSPP
ncbi:Protein of uncharacterised function (DUF3396) [Yersinia similis]|nr:Protein of uncharacterised function (DUF3396) [Yersinia similis]